MQLQLSLSCCSTAAPPAAHRCSTRSSLPSLAALPLLLPAASFSNAAVSFMFLHCCTTAAPPVAHCCFIAVPPSAPLAAPLTATFSFSTAAALHVAQFCCSCLLDAASSPQTPQLPPVRCSTHCNRFCTLPSILQLSLAPRLLSHCSCLLTAGASPLQLPPATHCYSTAAPPYLQPHLQLTCAHCCSTCSSTCAHSTVSASCTLLRCIFSVAAPKPQRHYIISLCCCSPAAALL